jgi:hypothetical protein
MLRVQPLLFQRGAGVPPRAGSFSGIARLDQHAARSRAALIAAALLLLAIAAAAQAQNPAAGIPAPVDSPSALCPPGAWLQSAWAWLLAHLLAIQFVLKLAQPKVTEFLAHLFAHVALTPDTADDAKLIRILRGFPYWLTRELLDLALRVKLPTLEEFLKLQPNSAPPTPPQP